MAQSQPRYKSEVFVPIRQDSRTFEERQRTIWDDINERMERHRKQWEEEVERMRRDFFRLKPSEARRGSSDNLLADRNLSDLFYDDRKSGEKHFRLSFDVSQFSPEEISVRTRDRKLSVYARHEEHADGKTVSREFSRDVDIPRDVDVSKLQCTLSNDGILQLEAPVLAPSYDRIQQAGMTSPQPSMTSSSPPPGHVTSSPFAAGPVITEQDGSRKFKISLDIGPEFEPQDVFVKTVDRKLIINAQHVTCAPGRSSRKEFSRQIDLPETVDPNLVTASMTSDGKLLIEAPIDSYQHGAYTGRQGSTREPTVTIAFGK